MTTAVDAIPDASGRARLVDIGCLVAGLLVLWTTTPHIGGDGEARYLALEHLLTTGEIDTPRHSLVGPLLAAPLYFMGKALGDAPAAVAYSNVLLFTVALGLLWRELSELLSPAARRTCLLLLVYGSMFPRHVQSFYGEVFTALCIGLGVLWLARRRAAAGWLAIALGALNTPATMIGVAAIAVRTAINGRKRAHLLAPLVIGALLCLQNYAAHGHPFVTGYEGDAGFRTTMPYSGEPGFSYPWFFGVLSILSSFGKGLLFFTPGLFAPLARGAKNQLRWVHGTLLWFVAGLVLVYAKWWSWYGGSFWGPRFFLVACLPAALALASHDHGPTEQPVYKRVLLLLAIAMSFWVGVNGLVFDQNGLDVCWDNDFALEAFCHFVPEMSVLWHPFVAFEAAVPEPQRRWLALATCGFWVAVCAWVLRNHLYALVQRGLARVARTLG